MDSKSDKYVIGKQYKLKSISELGFTRLGYIFKGWSKDGSSELIEDGATLTINDSSAELTAIWEDPILEDILTFTAVGEASTIQLKKVGTPYDVSLEYKVDDGSWTTFTPGSTIISLNAGQKTCLRSTVEDPQGTNSTPFSKNGNNYYQFAMTGKIAASGNIQYLIDKTGQRTSVADNCYYNMFYNCTNLTAAPQLPATQLADNCYYNMFPGCTSLTAAPALPATQLANACYMGMFQGCTSLTAAPALPATQLADYCYRSMFHNCTNLTAAPQLPATQLANSCYYNMFPGCTSLSAAPELPASQLAIYCYYGMFTDCFDVYDIYIPNLTESEYNAEKAAKSSGNLGREGQATFHFKDPIPEDILTFTADGEPSTIQLKKVGNPDPVSLEYFQDDSWKDYTIGNIISIPANGSIQMRAKDENATFSKNLNRYQFVVTGKIAASGSIQYLLSKDGNRKDVPAYCYNSMFYRCTSLTAAPALPATTLADDCYNSMFSGCTSLTAAPELPATTLADRCYNSMFYGCTSLTAAPELPATTLADYCYFNMFYGCTFLTAAPELLATTLADRCYSSMFDGCTSLTAAPELPATTLADDCYNGMFYRCTSLTAAPALPATQLADRCYFNMFYGCTFLTQAPELPASQLAIYCYYGMFTDCFDVYDIYIPNLTESEYNAEKAAKSSGNLGREGQATFHFKK